MTKKQKTQIIKTYIEKNKNKLFDDNNRNLVNAYQLFEAEKETGIDATDFMFYLRYGIVL